MPWLLFVYSGLNLNQDKAASRRQYNIVRQGEPTLYWFKFNSLYYKRCSTLLLKVSRIVKAAISASRNVVFSPSKAYS